MIRVLPCPTAFFWEENPLLCVRGAWFDPLREMALMLTTAPGIGLLQRLDDGDYLVRTADWNIARMTSAGDLLDAGPLERHRADQPEAGPFLLEQDDGACIVDLATGRRHRLDAAVEGDLHLDVASGTLFIVADEAVVAFDVDRGRVLWRAEPGGFPFAGVTGECLLLSIGAIGRPRTELLSRDKRDGRLLGHRILDHEFTPLAAHGNCAIGIARQSGKIYVENHDLMSDRTGRFCIERGLVQCVLPEAGLLFVYDWSAGESSQTHPDTVIGYDLTTGQARFRLRLGSLVLPFSMTFFRMPGGYATLAAAATPWPDNPSHLVLWEEEDVAAGGGEPVHEPWSVTSTREGAADVCHYVVRFDGLPSGFFQLLRQLGTEAQRLGQVHGYSVEVDGKPHDETFGGRIVCDLGGQALAALEREAIENMCAETTQALGEGGFRAGVDPAEPIVVEARFA